ncbi:MAG: hypothetical protein Q9170_005050 [Blastenia crenularia]
MEPIIATPRLRLTLVTEAKRGSPEFEWLHELRSNEKVTWWSLVGQSKSFEDTDKFVKGCLPNNESEEKMYKVVYAVHQLLGSGIGNGDGELQSEQQTQEPTRFIGLVNLYSLSDNRLALPEHLTLPAAAAKTTLTLELAYQFLPIAWGKGYAAESVEAVFEACKRALSFWTPFSKVYVQAIVNGGNPASLRVMQKTRMEEKGIYEWTGRVWLAGGWREKDDLHIFGAHLLE